MSLGDKAARVALTDVLSAVASELGLAQASCAGLDSTLGRLLDATPAERRGPLMRELHAVDLLNQQIAAVATFLERLSHRAPDVEFIDVGEALGAITLGEVAERLSVGVGQPPRLAVAAEEDVDFF
ncbi:MAG: hypothetical protein JWQ97_1267 [Phenylobacterium sp.]|nr:hypothetical protein [Phenylobacterium sp.]